MNDTATPENPLAVSLRRELELIWAAHRAVGLEGYMAVFTPPTQEIWRTQQTGLHIWFNAQEIQSAIDAVLTHYNNGKLPNSPLLLNPVVHEKTTEGTYRPLGSGVCWASAFALGIARMNNDMAARITGLGVLNAPITRGDEKGMGIKMLGLAARTLEVKENGTVEGCRELYDLVNQSSDLYWPYYLLSGINYLCTHGIFGQQHFDDLLPQGAKELPPENIAAGHRCDIQKIKEAHQCWEAYDRQHSLYMRFGRDPKDIPQNNRFFDLCARDLYLFDRTGPMREVGAEDAFEFIVNGWIPRGAVTLIAAPGGTGKSSLAHHLCVLAAMDLKPGDEEPVWLGQSLNREYCKGICVYFSGEDGPAIINARAELFDPEKRAIRIQFHRTEFMDREQSFAQYLTELRKMPDVPIVVVDPARKYLVGDENDAEVVSEFFEAIEEFAIRKRSAVVVVHHLQKGAKPATPAECLDELRGSQVFIDRPRVVIGMCRDDKYTVVGLAKNNIPPNLGMVTEDRVFARNPENLQLVWLPGEAGVRRKTLTPEELEALQES